MIKYRNLENKNYIIDCCQDYVVIYNPFNEEIYAKINNEKTRGDNRYAIIIYNKIYNKNKSDFLFIVNENGFIIMYDLKNKKTQKAFNLEIELYNILNWNDNYFIITQYEEDYLGKVNLEKNLEKISIEKFIICGRTIMCIKNIRLNEKEELIFAAGKNSSNIYILFYSQSVLNDKMKENL